MNQPNGIIGERGTLGQTEGHLQKLSDGIVHGQQMLEYVTGTGSQELLNRFKSVEERSFRMVLISTVKVREYSEMYFIKASAQRFFPKTEMCEIAGRHVIMLLNADDTDGLLPKLTMLKSELDKRFTYKADIIYSNAARMSELPDVYKRLAEKIEYVFYCDGLSVYDEDEFRRGGATNGHEYKGLGKALKYGDAINTKVILEDFFEAIKRERPEPYEARLGCYQLYACIITYCPQDMLEVYMSQISKFSRFTNIYQIEKFIMERAMEIVSENDPHNSKSYSTLIKDTVRIIDDNIGNENLSLRWLAGTILFTNVDYLGKLFKKETGKNFSYYVMEKRMELAKSLMLKKDRVYEVAQKVGYGSNSQYFSHVFKKYTGISPLEYKEFAKANRSDDK